MIRYDPHPVYFNTITQFTVDQWKTDTPAEPIVGPYAPNKQSTWPQTIRQSTWPQPRLQCGTVRWCSSSSSYSLHQTVHSGPQWNGSSSHQPFLACDRGCVSREKFVEAERKTDRESRRGEMERSTFSHEWRDLEIHDWDGGVVGHAVLLHSIKLHSSSHPLLLLCWRRQT